MSLSGSTGGALQTDNSNARDLKRIAVVVLGMHRSGTSAMARMLSLLGCQLPKVLNGALPSNPDGHWEAASIQQFNDELLQNVGSSWSDWAPINPDFAKSPVYASYINRAVGLLDAEFGDASFVVLKDPRVCRLGRFWMEALASADYEPVVILPLRNPLEVAASLASRDGFDENYSLLLWLRHVLDAEAVSRGRRRAFTSYAQMVDSWETVATRLRYDLGIAWPRMSPATQEEIGAFIDKRQRHGIVTTDALLKKESISSWVRRTWDILQGWAMGKEDAADYAELDAIAHAFDEAAPAFARLILRGKRAQHQVAELEPAMTEARTRIADLEAQGEQQLHSQHAALTQETAQASAECAVLREQIIELTDLREAAEAQAIELAGSNAELQLLLGEAQARVDASDQRLRDATLRLSEQTSFAAAEADRGAELANRTAELANRIAELESSLIQRREENEQVWRDVALEQTVSADLRQQLAEISQREATQRERLTEADAWVFRLAAERQAAEKESAAARAAQAAAERAKTSAEIAAARRAEALARHLHDVQATRADSEALLAQQAEKITGLTEMLQQANRAAEAAAAETARRIGQISFRLQAVEIAKAEAETQLAERFEEVARLTAILQQAERSAAAADARAKSVARQLRRVEESSQERCTELERLRDDALHGEASADNARLELVAAQAKRFNEIAVMTRLLGDREHQANDQGEKVEWLRKMQLALDAAPFWWHLLPRKLRRKRELELLSRKQLFDGKRYLARYPDVVAEGLDPLRHYLRHGLSEGRDRL